VEFIDVHRDRFGVAPICRVLSEHGCPIGPRTYYAFKTRPASARAIRDGELLVEIRRVHSAPRGGLYGVRKVWHQLRNEGIDVGRERVGRLMRAEGLQGVRRGRTVRTTLAAEAATRPADLVDRHFHAERPNQLWVVHFTYVAIFAGFVYVAFAIDVFSRMIVGWRADRSMTTDLPLDALDMALWHRGRRGQRVDSVIHHSDAGRQHTSIRYTDRLAEAGALASIGSVADSYDNAIAESIIGLFKTELVRWEGPWRGLDDLELATLGWIDWFNHTRLYEALEYRNPRSGRSRVLPFDPDPPRAGARGTTGWALTPGRFGL
jgi:putative transposase